MPAEEQLCKLIQQLYEDYSRYGYCRIAVLLRWERWQVGKCQSQSLR